MSSSHQMRLANMEKMKRARATRARMPPREIAPVASAASSAASASLSSAASASSPPSSPPSASSPSPAEAKHIAANKALAEAKRVAANKARTLIAQETAAKKQRATASALARARARYTQHTQREAGCRDVHDPYADTLPDTLSPSVLLARYRRQQHGWTNMDSVIVYRSPNFVFCPNVIVTELDDCLIRAIKIPKLYKSARSVVVRAGTDGSEYQPPQPIVTLFAEDLLKRLARDFRHGGNSIVIISNQVNTSKRNRGAIRAKLQPIIDAGLTMLCIFPTVSNRFMKPMTGSWELLVRLYKQESRSVMITSGTIVSNEGGLIVRMESKKPNTPAEDVVVSTDVDRAFAHNCNLKFRSIDEYLTNTAEQQPFAWDVSLASPQIRQKYIALSNEATRIDVLAEMLKHFAGGYTFMIMIMGPPRCGKSRLASQLAFDWKQNTALNKNHAVRVISEKTPSKMISAMRPAVKNLFSVIIDGWCNTIEEREPYFELAARRHIPVLCVDVKCGLRMAQIFNYVAVQKATTPDVTVHKERVYAEYDARSSVPEESKMVKYLIYTPVIEPSRSVCWFRY